MLKVDGQTPQTPGPIFVRSESHAGLSFLDGLEKVEANNKVLCVEPTNGRGIMGG